MNNKIIALDIGRVCVKLRFDLAKAALGYDSDAKIPLPFLLISEQYEHGLCSQQRWLNVFHWMTRKRFSDQQLIDAWNLIIGETIEGMPETIAELTEAGFSFVYFSDTNIPHIQKFISDFPVHHLIKGAIYSYEIGAHKPSKKMFRAFEEKYGRPCYYIDDKTSNIEGARKFGWTAHQFTTCDNFRSAFKAEFGV